MAHPVPAKSLPNGVAPHYNVSGLSAGQEDQVRNWINAMSPDAYPTGDMAFIPQDQWPGLTDKVAHGLFGNQPVAANSGPNGQEHFGQRGHTVIGDGFSLRSMNRAYLNAAIMQNPQMAQGVIAHELGHFAAPDASEDAAEHMKSIYLQRMQDTLRNWQMSSLIPSDRTSASAIPMVNALPPNNPFLK